MNQKNIYICENFLYRCFQQIDLPQRTTYYVIASAILMCLCAVSEAQVQTIGGIVNHYSKVTDIDHARKTVTLADVSMFKKQELPDTVLLVQMTGISVGGDMSTAGLYEFHIVTDVVGSTVILQSTPNEFNTGELVQMVRVPSYKNAQINSILTCKPWDWKSGTGGVLALMIDDSLTFNADIDVSGLGFKGGKAYMNEYNGPCSFNAGDGTNLPNYSDFYLYAGYKGEGAATIEYFNPNDPNSNLKGYAPTWNGGGGGNGKWSGGGGGSNGTIGGGGDHQVCSILPSNPVYGYNVANDVSNAGSPIAYRDLPVLSERMFMGGGGGAGTGIGTAGGNGGGIVVIAAHKLHFKPNTSIKANGGSVTETVTFAGAGGGGAGGSILLSVEKYGDIHAEIAGGKGGNVNRIFCNNITNSIGSGGGGSGGILFVRGEMDQYFDSKRVNFDGGNHGDNNITGGNTCNSSIIGGKGSVFNDFQVQLRGFFRNYIFTPNDTAICYNHSVTIRASQPVWGTEDKHNWQISSDGDEWTDIANISTLVPNSTYTSGLTFLTLQLTENLYFRRIVKSGGVEDISLPVRIIVYDDIVNNITPNETTLCWNNEKLIIRGNIPTEGGGGGPYTYEWEEFDTQHAIWNKINNILNSSLSVSLEPNGSIQKYQRRAVSSVGCVSTWDASKITVIAAINNNEIAPVNQEVCRKTAQLLTGGKLTGGDGNYNFRWEISTDNQKWDKISDRQDYEPNLNEQNYGENFYRRVITSDVCIDTSNVARVRFDRQPLRSEIKIVTNGQTGDQVLNFLFTAKLDVQQPSDAGFGEWSSTNEKLIFDAPNQPKTTVSNLQFGIHTISWTVKNGECLAVSDSVKIDVRDIEIPSGFSPNGDKINDCFRILGSENAASSELIIRDRYNKIVYESKSFNKGSSNLTDCTGWWDGCSTSGNELPSGTYFYQLILNGDKVYKGYVVLKR